MSPGVSKLSFCILSNLVNIRHIPSSAIGMGNFLNYLETEYRSSFLKTVSWDDVTRARSALTAGKSGNYSRIENHKLVGPFDEDNLRVEVFPVETFCPDITILTDSAFLRQLWQENICQGSQANFTATQKECCEAIKRGWNELHDTVTDLLLSSVQQPYHYVTDYHKQLDNSQLFPVKDRETSGLTVWPLLPHCHAIVNDHWHDCRDMFVPGPSVSGLVYSMNRPTVEHVVTSAANSLYTGKLQRPTGELQEDLCSTCPFFYDLVLFPDLQESQWKFTREFSIAVHDRHSLPDFTASPIRLESGKEYTIKLRAVHRTAEPSLRQMPVKKRKCMFRDEPHDLKLFKEYSRTSCKLECMIGKILKKCGCLPWDLIRDRDIPPGVPCYGRHIQCPRAVINANSYGDCHCPTDCEEVRYSYSVESKKWDAFYFCYNGLRDQADRLSNISRWDSWQRQVGTPMENFR